MKTGIINIIVVATVLLALSGCSTVSVQKLSEKYDRPILSAAEVRSMIRVDVTPLQPVSAEDAVMTASN